MRWSWSVITRRAQILEAYLNLAPYGRNIEGVGAASEIYSGKTAARIERTGSSCVKCDSAEPDAARPAQLAAKTSN